MIWIILQGCYFRWLQKLWGTRYIGLDYQGPRKSFMMLLKILQASRVFTFGPFFISLHSSEFNIGLFKLPSKLSVARIVPQIKHLQISDFFLHTYYSICPSQAIFYRFEWDLSLIFILINYQLNPGSVDWKIETISSTISHSRQKNSLTFGELWYLTWNHLKFKNPTRIHSAVLEILWV